MRERVMGGGIPLVDLASEYAEIKTEIDEAVKRVIDNKSFILGEEVERFEGEFSQHCNARYTIGLSSGTDALILALHANEIGPGDEVITTPMTFFATAEAIEQVGARPVFVDVEGSTHNIDVKQVESSLTRDSKALLPIHMHGQPADMDPLLEIAERQGLVVVEDAAQAHGAFYKDRSIGSISKTTCFSFYPGKNLGAYGDAGAIATNDDAINSRLRRLRDHGRKSKHEHDEIGFNARMDSLQAAILRAKLPQLNAWNVKRRTLAKAYSELLADLPLKIPSTPPWAEPVWHHYAIEVEDRNNLQGSLANAGISYGFHYPVPLHLQPAISHLGYRLGDFPIAEQISKRTLTLPLYPQMKEEQLQRIVDEIRNHYLH